MAKFVNRFNSVGGPPGRAGDESRKSSGRWGGSPRTQRPGKPMTCTRRVGWALDLRNRPKGDGIGSVDEAGARALLKRGKLPRSAREKRKPPCESEGRRSRLFPLFGKKLWDPGGISGAYENLPLEVKQFLQFAFVASGHTG